MQIVIAILILSAVIIFHELGHFLLAKANHIVVTEFAVGLGPKLISFTRGDTTYALKLLPFGGSCTMLGEDEDEEEKEGSFNKASVWRRISVIAAGPIFNFILAFLVAVIVISVVGSDPARVVSVEEGSPAAEAGLQAGDIITRYEGNGIANGRELYTDVDMDGVPLDTVTLTYERDGESHTVSYAPETTTRWMLGYYYSADEGPVEITSLMRGYPMEQAGFQAGDVITAINGVRVADADDVAAYWEEHPLDGSAVQVTYERESQEYVAEVTPVESTTASLGFDFNLAREKLSPVDTLKYSVGEMNYWVHVTVKSLLSLINGTYSINDLSGPIGVVDAIGQVYEQAQDQGGVIVSMTMLNMMILLSANLGVMNLLPLPALDGGRLIFLFIEAVRRKPIKRSVEGMIHFAGLMLLMVLMVYVAFNDVRRII